MPNIVFNFPDQTVSESEKTKDWHVNHVKSYITGFSRNNYLDRKNQIEKLYRAYYCILDKEEEKLFKDPICKPYGIDIGVEYQVYNLIEQKIEQLVGDYMGRPMKRKAYVLNKRAQIKKLDHKIDLLGEQIFRELNQEMKDEYGLNLETEAPELEVPDDVEEFFAKNYRSDAEETSDDLVEKFLDVDKQKQLIVPALIDFLICDEAHLKVVEQDGIVKWKKGHPLETDNDLDPQKVVQDDHEYYVTLNYLSKNEIYNTFPDLNANERRQIESDFNVLLSTRTNSKLNSSSGNLLIDDKGWYVEDNQEFKIAIIEMNWKSRKTIRSKTYTDNEGNERSKLLSEKDRVRKGEKEHKISIEQPRHVIMAGPNLCLSYGLDEHRMYRIGNKKKCYLDAVSVYRQNSVGASKIRSVAAKLYKMQYWASELLFELRVAFRRNNGKVMVYDSAQIPRQFLKSDSHTNAMNRVLHHAKKDNMVIINSKDKNNRYAFNQFTSVDLSTKGLIQDIIAGLTLIEDLADRMIGLTPGRQGLAGQYSTTANVEAQRQASFARTEIYFQPFDDFIQASLDRMIMKSKFVYEEGDTIQYVLGDLRSKFLPLLPDFFQADIGMYLADGTKDAKKKQIIDQAAELTLGNAQTEEMILSLIDVLCEDTAVESRAILERSVKAAAEIRNQSQQQQMEMQQAQMQADQKDKDDKNKLTARGQDKDIAVAEIYENGNQNKTDKQEATKRMTKLADIEQMNIDRILNNSQNNKTE